VRMIRSGYDSYGYVLSVGFTRKISTMVNSGSATPRPI
jgi:hypothetical protein